MYSDFDIKIAGDKPSQDVKTNLEKADAEAEMPAGMISGAKAWGREVAEKFIEDATEQKESEADYLEMLIQRRMLLSFTATAGFEELSGNDALSGIAQKSFIDTIKKSDAEIFKTVSDTGAFSFYYLAFRRGGEVDRRIGQTFAMLCGHDGDPIFQELGEALYCWFFSVVKKSAKNNGIY